MKYLILMIGLMSGCGRSGPVVDPALAGLYDKFMADAQAHGVEIDQGRINELAMSFGDLGKKADLAGPMIGYCDVNGHGHQVVVDKTFWDSSNDIDKESLVFHELGHCLLDRQHVFELDSNGVPVSIMYPYLVGYTLYNSTDQTYAAYNDELFTHVDDWSGALAMGCKMGAL